MKKIIAMFLVLTMLLSLAACGKKTEEPVVTIPVSDLVDTPAETEPIVEETEPVVDTPVIEEPVDAPAVVGLSLPELTLGDDAADKQAYWETVFATNDFAMNTNSVKMNFNDLFKMDVLTDAEGRTMVGISGVVEGTEVGVELYKLSDTENYCREYSSADGTVEETWAAVTIAEGETFLGEDSAVVADEDLTAWQNSTETATYIGSHDGLDYVEIMYVDSDAEEDDDWVTVIDASYEVEYNGNVGLFQYTAKETKEGTGKINSSYWLVEIPDENIEDWTFDSEALTLTKDDVVLDCVLVDDYMNQPVEEIPVILILNPENNNIVGMQMEVEGMMCAISFAEIDNLSSLVTIPADMTNTVTAEEATMSLAMAMMVFIYSAVDMSALG